MYRAKRDFKATREPQGRSVRRKAKAQGGAFVVQKHAARRLHYDLRLEHDGVLWSWAVTRGPSLDPDEKRLAVHVEDHPLEYGGFEGTIPPGQYGAGSVIVWDEGTWSPEGDPAAGIEKGHLSFTLTGHKLRGAWHLVRMKPRRGEKRDNWLLIKADDDFARRDDDILETAPDSVKTGLSVDEIGQSDTHGGVWTRAEAASKGSASKTREPEIPRPESLKPGKPPSKRRQVARSAFHGS
nr:DNA polymerase ligase N-terminal domain-containing protein [Chelatococcus asaccharovorans]